MIPTAVRSVSAILQNARRFLCPRQKLLYMPCATKFWEPDPKGGYKSKISKPVLQSIKEGTQMIGPEVEKFKGEVLEKIRCDNVFNLHPGDYEVLWKFDNTDTINDWVVTTDRDNNEGKSTAQFTLTRNKTGVFHGSLNTAPTKDGVVKHAGYCNIKSPRKFRSFYREDSYNWERYTHVLIRCRGDGRPFHLILGMNRYFDVQWLDQYNYILFTRGGPYWQTAKIPFSKFFLSSRGRIQDKQESVMNQLDKIAYLGITLGDGASGPFQLEIDYVALVYDAAHKEHFAYELYQSAPHIIHS